MRFRYLRDPLCLGACALYAVNRWLWIPLAGGWFVRGHLNDLLLIPAALPPVLWVQRRLEVRVHDRAPDWTEVLFHLALWAVLFEAIGPRFMRVTGDPLDVVAYAVGAVASGWWWSKFPGDPASGDEL